MGESWDFQAFEDMNGLRFSWNEWPSNKTEANRVVVPIAALYTPMKHIETMPPPFEYEPLRCKCSDLNRTRPSPRAGPPLRRKASAAPTEERIGVMCSFPAVRWTASFTAFRSMLNGSPVRGSVVGSGG